MEHVTRDEVCIALSELYGYGPNDFDGMTLAEISQDLELYQLEQLDDYLRPEPTGLWDEFSQHEINQMIY